jgi:hypothetical protein
MTKRERLIGTGVIVRACRQGRIVQKCGGGCRSNRCLELVEGQTHIVQCFKLFKHIVLEWNGSEQVELNSSIDRRGRKGNGQ